MPRGGKRPGAGKPKGYKHPHTLEKLWAREYYRVRMATAFDRIIDAQIESAAGVYQFVYRDEHGKFKVIDDPDELAACISMGKAVRLFTRLPSPQAQADVLNRIMDKPTEQVNVTGADGGPLEIRWKS